MSDSSHIDEVIQSFEELDKESPKNKSAHIASKLNQSVINSMGKQIIKSKVTISQKPASIDKLMSESKSKDNKKSEKAYNEIYRKKQQLELQLQKVKYQESIAKKNRPIPMRESQQGKTMYFRSTLTPEQKSKLSTIIKETKNFEKQAQQKTIKLQQKIKQMQQRQKIQIQKRRKELSQEKKRQSEKRIEAMKNKKQIRQKIMNTTQKEFQKVKKQKFLHEIIDEKWKIKEVSQEEENQKIQKKNRSDHKFNHEQIMTHSRRYSQIMGQQKQKREINKLKFREDMVQKIKAQKHPQSTFLKTISQEEAYRQKKEQEKMMASHVFTTKKTIYAQTVRQKFKQKFSSTAVSRQPKENQMPNLKRTQSLDYFAINKLGNDYMKQIKACIGEEQIKRSREQEGQKSPPVFKYPDYLTKARAKRQSQNPEKESQQIREIRKLIKKKQKIDNRQSLNQKNARLVKAKQLAQRLDEKAMDGFHNSKALVDSINAKISIIEEFSK